MTTLPPDLNFHNSDTLYATHGLHAFAAKFPPQLAAWAVEEFAKPGQIVCDPMMGSGTTLVEAYISGHRAIGIDIDPLACMIAAAKSTPIEGVTLRSANTKLLTAIDHLQSRSAKPELTLVSTFDSQRNRRLPALPRLDYWFSQDVQQALLILKEGIQTVEASASVRQFWYTAFSSLIVAKASVANARDIVHSRHHYYQRDTPPDVFKRFRQRLQQMERQMDGLEQATVAYDIQRTVPSIHRGDARRLELADDSVDFVLTSPPYCNALDYTRAHRFAVAWLADVLTLDLEQYMLLGREYIGSERGGRQPDAGTTGVPVADQITEQVKALDPHRGSLVARYFADMYAVIDQIGRILRPGTYAVIVVCPSNIRKIPIDWHTAFSAFGAKLPARRRLHEVAVIERTIDDRRRLLPYMNAGDQLAQRMRTEYVLVLQKCKANL